MEEPNKIKSKQAYGAVYDDELRGCDVSNLNWNSSERRFKLGPLLYFALVVCTLALVLSLLDSVGKYDLLPTFSLEQQKVEGSEDTEGFLADLVVLEKKALLHSTTNPPKPFSELDPVSDLQLYPFVRPKWSRPSEVFGDLQNDQIETEHPLPTNEWYQNLLLLSDGSEPSGDNRVYTLPYVVDAAGPIAGIRLFETKLLGMDRVVQVTYVDFHGLTLGATYDYSEAGTKTARKTLQKRYTLYDRHFHNKSAKLSSFPLTPLGISLKWETNSSADLFHMMTSSIVRGMPYGSMHYHYRHSNDFSSTTLPTVASEIALHSAPIVDSKRPLMCSNMVNKEGTEELVKKSVTLSFIESDFTWLVFYSHPVYVRCYETLDKPRFILQAVRLSDREMINLNYDALFTSRIALVNNCTRGTNPSHCVSGEAQNRPEFSALLHKHAEVYPGQNTKIDYTFFSEEKNHGGEYSYLQFDWDARHVRHAEFSDKDLLMYALPHHREVLKSFSTLTTLKNDGMHCTSTLNGKACLVQGSKWLLKEDLGEEPSFWAPREPMATAIPNLAESINNDIHFRVPGYYTRGVGDTYFSGKVLAKLGRILLITEEISQMCSKLDGSGGNLYKECDNITLPSKEVFGQALDNLKSSTEIWINGTAEIPFVYDTKWGGLASCGCYFNGETQKCDNTFPDCPAFSDPGLDFGHAFFNDHHYHQGYHVYAAACVAHFDHAWGEKHFEEVLLLIRDFANPSVEDIYFPAYRMKDWYLGNSWAGGIGALYPNGRNQESSSEAIAAYEAVSLFGKVMTDVLELKPNVSNIDKASKARYIRDVGRLLTATELRAAARYWHVIQSKKEGRIYPEQYKESVVGINWNMMVQFQTWFGNAPYLAYGIQLLPLTAVAEKRDDIEWAMELYPSFAKSCQSFDNCDAQGWGILQHAILATVGYPNEAIKYVESLPKEIFESAGGNGHSLTNSIWYYATRPKTTPLTLENDKAMNCGCPKTCTTAVLNSSVGGSTCVDRIQWLMKNDGKSQPDACSQVAGVEFRNVCAGCDPDRCTAPMVSPTVLTHQCPICSHEICENGELNKCPPVDAPFVCIDGRNKGGCSMVPWVLGTTGDRKSVV